MGATDILSFRQQLAPRYFISYSRKQLSIAESLRDVLPNESQAVWFDQDDISHGDDWMAEIEQGITECDELVLIVSEDSLQSAIVKEEVAIAERQGKLIRPCVLDNLDENKLAAVNKYHYVLLDASGDNTAILTFLFDPPHKNDLQYLKTKAVRGIYPEFRFPMDAQVKVHFRDSGRHLARIHENYHASSAVWLNYGLVLCMDQQWARGIEILRRHAEAANNATGWYFYGLHAGEGKRLSSRSLKQANVIFAASQRATMALHPLIQLLVLFAGIGAENHGAARAEREWNRIKLKRYDAIEGASEYLRFVWCMRASFEDLGRLKNDVMGYLKGRTV